MCVCEWKQDLLFFSFMAFSFSLKHVFFSIILLTLAHSCCKGLYCFYIINFLAQISALWLSNLSYHDLNLTKYYFLIVFLLKFWQVHGQGQGLDAVQIVATSALCFDNRTVSKHPKISFNMLLELLFSNSQIFHALTTFLFYFFSERLFKIA